MISNKADRLKAIFLVAPSVLAVFIFVYGFIFWSLRVSLSSWDGILPNMNFAGLANYIETFASRRFRIDMWNTLYFTIFFLLLTILSGFILALILDRKIRFENFFRSLYLFPMAISFVVTGVAWRWIFNPEVGLNSLLRTLGIEANWGWYTDPSAYGNFHVALIPVIIAASWQLTGYTMAMYLAGLRSIPTEIVEATRIDGASYFQRLRYVTIPLLRPITMSAIIMLSHISLKIFDLVYAMTGKGPAFATDVPGIFMFETTFRGNHYAQGAVISMVMLILVAMAIIPYLASTFRKGAK